MQFVNILPKHQLVLVFALAPAKATPTSERQLESSIVGVALARYAQLAFCNY